MGLFQSFDICASGMTAERFRMDTIAENIANINTTRTEDGTPYRRKIVRFTEKTLNPTFAEVLAAKRTSGTYGGNKPFEGNGVKVSGIYNDYKTDFVMAYEPEHPDADENGYVRYPNVNTVTEMTNLIDASRGYEANVTAFNAVKTAAQQGINAGGNS
ncbi:MAG: flagellar basal body rod protein FlgC [Lachnospiraceae bacterium]|nr:flagellar basal body rod protein FlgC [Lachnospiraceae bacterium]